MKSLIDHPKGTGLRQRLYENSGERPVAHGKFECLLSRFSFILFVHNVEPDSTVLFLKTIELLTVFITAKLLFRFDELKRRNFRL